MLLLANSVFSIQQSGAVCPSHPIVLLLSTHVFSANRVWAFFVS